MSIPKSGLTNSSCIEAPAQSASMSRHASWVICSRPRAREAGTLHPLSVQDRQAIMGQGHRRVQLRRHTHPRDAGPECAPGSLAAAIRLLVLAAKLRKNQVLLMSFSHVFRAAALAARTALAAAFAAFDIAFAASDAAFLVASTSDLMAVSTEALAF